LALEKKYIAIITDSPALGSIIAMMLESEEQLHIQQFDTASTLRAHMRIVPLDLIVMDYHLERITAAQLVLDLRRDLPQRQFETLVLTSRVSAEIKLACKFARINEVIIKPMSPVFLKERVLSRLQIGHFVRDSASDKTTPAASVPAREKAAHLGPGSSLPGNVVSLFKSGHPPHHSTNRPQHF